ncbi:hypothetical protein BS47DRAFT_1385952 [Hydnum rufescens UP504]|uniref:Uncharacterized protein n=1 Tax=Hydnum rufescens UP504 TaxID=1448309 RepID=A0A9P6AGJ5_9AGAM|nr:hypothetical protein BS47DRAFT_1385951 [Hydnum rufescens UP504]KAF9505476.1 hypothetical protein BS47DRAFT_1385952 [Hydnum rufescens UP504]
MILPALISQEFPVVPVLFVLLSLFQALTISPGPGFPLYQAQGSICGYFFYAFLATASAPLRSGQLPVLSCTGSCRIETAYSNTDESKTHHHTPETLGCGDKDPPLAISGLKICPFPLSSLSPTFPGGKVA